MTKPRSARVRSDFWVHPKTEWLSPLHRSIILHASAHSILGVVEHSISKLAGLHKSTFAKTKRALVELSEAQLVSWWPKLDIVWVVEAADENIGGDHSDSAWVKARKEWRTYPHEVREAISARYPQICNAGYVPPRQDHPSTPEVEPPDTPTPLYLGIDMDMDSDTDTDTDPADLVATWICDARKRLLGNARKQKLTKDFRKMVNKPLKSGYSLDDWATAIRRQERSLANDLEGAKKWLTVMTIHRPENFARLLDREDLDDPTDENTPSDARGSIETADEAKTWAESHGGKAPPGWLWAGSQLIKRSEKWW